MTKVLLVEDNDMNRDMLSRRLRRRGYEVYEASSGEEGHEAAASWQPDIVLMDMTLPGMDGCAATIVLKKDDRTKAIPVMGLSAHILPVNRQRGLDAGCAEYLTKPVDFERLLEKIEALVSHQP